MIRINLLPKKVSKKKLGVMQHLAAAGAVYLLTLVAIGYFWMSLNGTIEDLRRKVNIAQAEKESLKDVNRQKKNYETNIAKLRNKLDIITKIKEKRFVPIRLFDELTKVLDRSMPVWLTKYSYDKDVVKMEGYSLSNPDLAAFVTKMEKTPFYEEVDLLFSEKVKKDERQIFHFSITAKAQTKDDSAPEKATE